MIGFLEYGTRGGIDVRRWLQRKASSMNSKARRLRVPGSVTPELLVGLGNVCVYCGIEVPPGNGSFDHKVAFDRGGTNLITNIVRCCTTCNRMKFSKSEQEYGASLALVTCALPGCGKQWRPRWGERQRGMAKYCSLSHSAKGGWLQRRVSVSS